MRSPLRAPFLLAAAASLALVSTAAAQKRATAHEDVWLLRRLGEPALAPDGSRAVFPVTEPAYEPDATVRDLWVVATDGSSPARRLTATPGGESGAVWSPDGTAIAFTARRDGDDVDQVYVLDMTAPGEARRVTASDLAVANPCWSPDGTAIAFECLVPAPAAGGAIGAEVRPEDQGVRASAYETFPVRYWDRWLDGSRVHLFVQPVDDPSAARDLLAGTALAAARGYSGVPGRSRDELQATWSPDGRELLFVATTERDRSAFAPVRYHLWRVGIAGGEPRRVTDDEAASEAKPSFEPGGDRLYWERRPVGEWAYSLPELMVRAWPAGAPRRLGAGLDRPVEAFAARRGVLWLLATEHGRCRVFRGALEGDAAPRLLDPDSRGAHGGLAAADDGSVLVTRWEDSVHPAEIVRVDPATGTLTPLTSFNTARVAALDREPFREFWFDAGDGRRVHAWMVLPPGFDPGRRYPLLTWMHGGPHSSALDTDHVRWSPHLLAAPGYVVILPDYAGSIGYGEAFARAIQGDPLRKPGDDLLAAARFAAEQFPFVDGSRQAALGASYGGHLANWMQATTDHFRCLVGHAGLVSLEGQWATSDVIHHRELNHGGPPWEDAAVWREQSPATHAGAFRTPMLLTIGERDYRVPLNQTLAAWTYLQRRQVPGRLVVFHEANHWVMRGADARYFWREVHAFLARHLGSSD